MTAFRLDKGGAIDRSAPLSFRFDGRSMTGFKGDTLASALLANGRMLVDGALVNPVPVSVCRAQEQPLVVAVNLSTDNFGRAAVIRHSAGELAAEREATAGHREADSRLGITGVMVEAFNIIQDRISRARLAGDPPDLSLQPKLSHVGLTEFHRADEAIRLGYETAMAQIGELRRLQTVLV